MYEQSVYDVYTLLVNGFGWPVTVRPPTSDRFLLRFIRSLPLLLLFCSYTINALLSHALHVILSPGRRRLNRKKMGYTIQSSIVIDIFVWLWASVVCDIVRKATPPPSAHPENVYNMRLHVFVTVCAQVAVYFCVCMCMNTCVYLALWAT